MKEKDMKLMFIKIALIKTFMFCLDVAAFIFLMKAVYNALFIQYRLRITWYNSESSTL